MTKIYFSKLTLVQLVTIILSAIGLILSATTTFIGSGTPRQITIQPRLQYETTQIETDLITLSKCTIKNTGLSLAKEIVVQIHFEDNLPFLDKVRIEGGEGRHQIESGGKVGDTAVRIYLDRLVNGDEFSVVVATDSPSQFVCNANSTLGKASIVVEESQSSLTFWFLLLFSSQIVIIFILTLRTNNSNHVLEQTS